MQEEFYKKRENKIAQAKEANRWRLFYLCRYPIVSLLAPILIYFEIQREGEVFPFKSDKFEC